VGRKQHSLGPNEAEAKQKYYAIMADRQAATDTSQVIALLKKFLAWNKQHRSAGSQTFYSRPILSFAEHIGESLTVDKLKNHHVWDEIAATINKTRRQAQRILVDAKHVVMGGIMADNILETKRRRAALATAVSMARGPATRKPGVGLRDWRRQNAA
jgi:hypothetical protein